MIESYGFITKRMNAELIISRNLQRYVMKSRETNKQKGRVPDAQQTAVRAIITGALQTPPQGTNTNNRRCPKDDVPDRQLLQMLGLPPGSHRQLVKCRELRTAAMVGLDSAFDFVGPKRCWRKVSNDVWDRFRHVWLSNSPYVTHIPLKTETVHMRDTDNKVLKNDNQPIITQKMMCQLCPREIFLEMLKPPDERGFDGARDPEGNVVMSKTTMRRRWPNWIVCMTNRFKATCVCDSCGVPSEGEVSLNIKRRLIIKTLQAEGKFMRPDNRLLS